MEKTLQEDVPGVVEVLDAKDLEVPNALALFLSEPGVDGAIGLEDNGS